MARVVFPFHVIHGGILRPPFKPFEVQDSEVSKLVERGAKVAETAPKASGKATSAAQTVRRQKRG